MYAMLRIFRGPFSRSVEKLAWTKNLISSDPLFGAWSLF
jgi:hypothetical protein